VLGSVAERLSENFGDIARVFYVALTAARRPCRSTTPWCARSRHRSRAAARRPERARRADGSGTKGLARVSRAIVLARAKARA